MEQEIAQIKAELNTTSDRIGMTAKVAQLNALSDKLLRDSQIISPYNGIITEQKANEGMLIAAGAPVFGVRLDEDRGDTLAPLYVPVLDGKRVKTGMTVQIAPGTVDASQYGSLIGRVKSVSDYPVATESVMNWAGSKRNGGLILQKGGGAVMEIQVELIKDPDTKTGYLWSSIMGAPDDYAGHGLYGQCGGEAAGADYEGVSKTEPVAAERLRWRNNRESRPRSFCRWRQSNAAPPRWVLFWVTTACRCHRSGRAWNAAFPVTAASAGNILAGGPAAGHGGTRLSLCCRGFEAAEGRW